MLPFIQVGRVHPLYAGSENAPPMELRKSPSLVDTVRWPVYVRAKRYRNAPARSVRQVISQTVIVKKVALTPHVRSCFTTITPGFLLTNAVTSALCVINDVHLCCWQQVQACSCLYQIAGRLLVPWHSECYLGTEMDNI